MARPGNAWRQVILWGIVLTALAAGGCATGLRTGDLGVMMGAGDCGLIEKTVESHPDGYGAGSELLFAMDAAMAFMHCGDDAAAQRWFREADRLGQDLWTESVSRQAASFLAGDTVLKYPGEDYERVMINLMSAIGFLGAGEPDEALVECRRLDSLLNVYNAKYEHENVYSEDAFARYLSGMLYEDEGSLDDAFIDYLRAAKAYADYGAQYGTPLPRPLKEDLFRVAVRIGRLAEARALFPDDGKDGRPPQWSTKGLGRIVYIQIAGAAPRKEQDVVFIPFKDGPVPLAFPRMVITPPACGGGRLELRAEGVEVLTEAVLVEDINRIAMKNLADRRVRVIAKTLARAVAKQLVIGGIANSADDPNTQATIRAALNIVNMFVERADTRSWRTLPGEVYMTRVYVAPGDYRVRVSGCGRDRTLDTVAVRAGSTRYIVDDARFTQSEGRAAALPVR